MLVAWMGRGRSEDDDEDNADGAAQGDVARARGGRHEVAAPGVGR
jgi:hypothetical protein